MIKGWPVKPKEVVVDDKHGENKRKVPCGGDGGQIVEISDEVHEHDGEKDDTHPHAVMIVEPVPIRDLKTEYTGESWGHEFVSP